MARRTHRSRIQHKQPALLQGSPDQVLVRRAQRHHRRGEHRQAMLALRQACQHSGHSPRLWTLYGVACLRVRRVDDARQALRQALWLRQRARDVGRARVMERLIEQLDGPLSVRLPLRAA
jgi:Flp pilus assembly protein TadD